MARLLLHCCDRCLTTAETETGFSVFFAPPTIMGFEDLSMFGLRDNDAVRSVFIHLFTAEDERGLYAKVRAEAASLFSGIKLERKTFRFSREKEATYQRWWIGMPSYRNVDRGVHASLRSYMRSHAAVARFAELMGLPIPDLKALNMSLCYPPRVKRNLIARQWVSDHTMKPRYPVYIPSRRGADSRHTARQLEMMNTPYRIVIEPQEYEQYAAVIDPRRILVLPFSNLGQGSIPARNWVWEHSIGEGNRRHWILDDNILHFVRRTKNEKRFVRTCNIFRAAEDYVDRWANVAMAGFNYQQFIPDTEQMPPFYANTRVYSCILIQNDVPHRWRGKYNEDTDLSLRVLQDGWCTLLFNAFLITKAPTMKLPGGNTDEVYERGKKRLEFVLSLQKQHPELVRVVNRYQRVHHWVDYTPFATNQLKPKRGKKRAIQQKRNEYGMRLDKPPS